MCSIMGYCRKGVSIAQFERAFAKTKSRGPDATRILDVQEGLLGFHRLAIMGMDDSGMQPFMLNNSVIVCNGEIYGFHALRRQLIEKGYTFQSESDCEVLLPLYAEMGTAMFAQLDAEFALILYDGDKHQFLAARDPIGIRPLYYGYDKDGAIIFASEPKNLLTLCEQIYPFPPGHYYADGEFCSYRDMTKKVEIREKALDSICKQIHDRLIDGVKKRLDADAPLGFLLSGGLDSSLVCAIASRLLHTSIPTFAIGMDQDAIDLKYAREVAAYLHSDHREVIITKKDVIDALPAVIHALATYDITTIRASIGMYLLCQWIHEYTDIRVLMTGEISDELFGYKYTDFAPDAAAFQEESEKRIRELHMYDVLRADRCISVHSMEARVPFGDLAFVEYVMSVDPLKKMNQYGKGKYLLRHAFEGNYLPRHILMREKAAFSDAVGHSLRDEIQRYAQAYYTDEEWKEKKERYTYAKPFSKESLLYRELFESFYPGQAKMIRGFWMPNKTWKGCDVDDPSARVLSNYGDSGC